MLLQLKNRALFTQEFFQKCCQDFLTSWGLPGLPYFGSVGIFLHTAPSVGIFLTSKVIRSGYIQWLDCPQPLEIHCQFHYKIMTRRLTSFRGSRGELCRFFRRIKISARATYSHFAACLTKNNTQKKAHRDAVFLALRHCLLCSFYLIIQGRQLPSSQEHNSF